MKTKEEYYQQVTLVNKKMAKDSQVTSCPCPRIGCEWHGNCKACVTQHTWKGNHLPVCQQLTAKNIIAALAAKHDIKLEDKEETPPDYRFYANQRYFEESNNNPNQNPEDRAQIPTQKLPLSKAELEKYSLAELVKMLAAVVEMKVKD